MIPLGGGLPAPTPVAAGVWVMFESADADHPVVLGRIPPLGEPAPDEDPAG